MIVTILYRLAGSPDIEDENWGYPYVDVDANAYYGTAVYWARLNGIASGYSDERFGRMMLSPVNSLRSCSTVLPRRRVMT